MAMDYVRLKFELYCLYRFQNCWTKSDIAKTIGVTSAGLPGYILKEEHCMQDFKHMLRSFGIDYNEETKTFE